MIPGEHDNGCGDKRQSIQKLMGRIRKLTLHDLECLIALLRGLVGSEVGPHRMTFAEGLIWHGGGLWPREERFFR